LIARRDKIGKLFLNRVIPLDKFAVKNDELVFYDPAQERNLKANGQLQIAWSHFDNQSQKKAPIASVTGFRLPSEVLSGSSVSYVAAEIWRGDDRRKAVTLYLRIEDGRAEVVGVDRTR
jgi:hypothetical protein